MPLSTSPDDILAFHTHPAARVAVVSLRGTQREVWRALPFEFEDLITQMDAADIVGPAAVVRRSPFQKRVQRALQRFVKPRPYAPAVRPLPTTDRLYDMLFVPIGDFGELGLFKQLRPWMESSRVRVAWIVELWSQSIPLNAGAIRQLQHFDIIAVGCENSVEPLQKALGKPCFYLPAGVDAMRMMPGDPPAPRHIDVYQMGRRSNATHQALLTMSNQRGWYYLYDTSWGLETNDPVQHRALLANTIKRSRFFIANRAKVDAPQQTGGQQEVGFRFFEGAAAGTIMLGEIPDTPSFKQLFGWEDAVIALPFGSDNVEAVIDELLASPERMAAIQARNVRESLLRHDWAYRWQALLEQAGLPPMSALLARQKRLGELADAVAVPAAGRRADSGNVVRFQRG
ncbi:MAG: glycosyltransferase family 1 protein [Rubrivivax sp.]|nr:glycosyltransferase family 1 protein [Rubrivivax sp.]